MNGLAVLAAIVVVWPLSGWLVAAAFSRSAEQRWRPFAWAAGAAASAAVIVVLAAEITFSRNGTTAAMTAMGGMVVAGACLAGGLLSGLCALFLRARAER